MELEAKRSADRAYRRRLAAVARGEDPSAVNGHPQPSARIRLPLAAVKPVRITPPCATEGNPDLWFPVSMAEWDAAAQICQGCPAREQCLSGAIERSEPWGVWGGVLFEEGRIIRRVAVAS